MDKYLPAITQAIGTLYTDIGSILAPPGTILRCPVCAQTCALTPDMAAHYTRHGWPTCCGQAMRREEVVQARQAEEGGERITDPDVDILGGNGG